MVKSEYYVEHMDLEGKNVVCRCDFNVPMKNGVIMDDFRIRSAIPTIQTILSKKPTRVIIVSHLLMLILFIIRIFIISYKYVQADLIFRHHI